MKRLNYFKPIITIFSLIVILMGACDQEAIEETQFASFKTASDATYPLYAGQHEYVGDLIVSIDVNNNLWATFSSKGSCEFTEFALFVGELSDVSLSGGNTPQPGHFNYKNETGEFGPINLNGLSDDFVILAHAVCGEETIWAQPQCVPIVDDYSFENVFGSNRWGWIIKPGDEECNETEDVLIIKVRMIDKSDFSQVYGYINTGSDYVYQDNENWCSNLSLVTPNDGDSFPVQLEGDPNVVIANADISIDNNNLIVTIETVNINSFEMYFSYVYYGEEENIPLNYTGCPDYKSFEYQQVERGLSHTYTIPY